MSWISAAVIGGSTLANMGMNYFGGQGSGAGAAAQAYQNQIMPWYNLGSGAANTLTTALGGGQATGPVGQSGGLLNAPAFNFNLNQAMSADNTGGQMTNEVMSEIGAQRAASGGFGSGNMGTDISDYIAGTYEPSLYNQALQGYNTNINTQYQMPYNMLMGAMNGTSGIAQGSADSSAASIMGNANAQANQNTGMMNQSNSGAGLFMNYMNSQNLMKMLGNRGGGGGGVPYSSYDYGMGYDPSVMGDGSIDMMYGY